MHVADTAVLDRFDRALEMGPGALLNPDLRHAIVPARRLHHQPALPHVVG